MKIWHKNHFLFLLYVEKNVLYRINVIVFKSADLPFFSVENRILGQGRVPKNNRYINQSSDSEPSNFKRLI